MLTIPRFARAVTAQLALVAMLVGCGQTSPQALMAEAESDFAKRDFSSAIVRLKKAVQGDPNLVSARVLLGRALYETGDMPGAAVELTKSLDQNADINKVMPSLAKAMLLSGQQKKLLALYANVKLVDRTADADFKVSLATAHALTGDMAACNALLAAVTKELPKYPPALLLRARLEAGRGDFADSLKTIDEVLALDGSFFEAWNFKGEVQAYGLKDWKSAEPLFQKASELNSRYFPALAALTTARIQNGDVPGAKVQFEKLRGVAPVHPATLFLQAQLAYYGKDFAKSKEITQLILRVEPEHVGALQLLSALEWEANSPVLAARPLETALKINPELPGVRTNLAYVYLRLGQPTQAREVLEPLVSREKAPSRALAAAGEASVQLGQLDEAEAFYTRASQSAPADSQSRTALALTRLAKGDANAAFADLQTLAAQTKETYADVALIAARMRRGDLDAALSAVDALEKKTPNDPGAIEMRGRVLAARGDSQAARAAFERALSLQPKLLSAVASLVELDLRENLQNQAKSRAVAFTKAEPQNFAGFVLLADIQRRIGANPAEVQETLQQSIRVAPAEATPRLRLIDLLAAHKQIATARSVAQEGVAAIPNNVRLLDSLGLMQLRSGERQQALTTFRSITAIDPASAGAHVRMAEVHSASGDPAAAVGELRRALELDPKLAAARLSLVDLLVGQKRSKEAIEIAKTLQRREPASASGYLLEGDVYRTQKNFAAASVAYREGLDKATERITLALSYYGSLIAQGKRPEAEKFALGWLEKSPEDGAVRYQLAEFYMSQGSLPKAEQHFRLALKVRPDFAPALNNLSWVLAQQGKPGAIAMAERALALLPNEPTYLDTLATAQASEKQAKVALETQRRAVQIAPGDLGMRVRLAKYALAVGDTSLARSELQRVLSATQKGPQHDEAVSLLKGL